MIPAAFLRWIPYILAVVALFGIGYYQGSRNGAAKVSECRADHAAYLAKVAEDNATMVALYRKKEQAVAEDFAMIAAEHQDKLAEVTREAKESVLADVRAGRVRVRIASCPRVPAASEAASGPSVDHGEAVGGDQAADLAAGAIAIGAEADAQLAACQATLTAERSK